jgi:hypothetical protein
MKNTKSILMAAAAALSIASASAQEVIYITGATAFRSAANNTLYSLYGDKLLASSGSSTNDSGAIALYFKDCVLTNGNGRTTWRTNTCVGTNSNCSSSLGTVTRQCSK